MRRQSLFNLSILCSLVSFNIYAGTAVHPAKSPSDSSPIPVLSEGGVPIPFPGVGEISGGNRVDLEGKTPSTKDPSNGSSQGDEPGTSGIPKPK